MSDRIKHFLIGPPLPTHLSKHKHLNKIRALAAFSPDALSSIAYANQEIYLGLVVAGSVGLSQSLPVAAAITVVLAIVAVSYFQTIHGYPSGGGSYTVARKNLGVIPALMAGAALSIDYVLTAAVSLTAGVAAIASTFPQLWSYQVGLSLLFLLVITVMNLRGLRETGTAMAVPVYLFLFTYLPMLAYGAIFVVTKGQLPVVTTVPPPTQPLTLVLLLHAFSTGCTALTGIEAISNGVPAFQPPESRNAGRTMIVMAFLMGILFIGSIGLTQALAVVAGPQETILSALARRLLGSGPAYLIVQGSTMLILAVAANTSFADFPRLAAILAADGFLPRQLTSVGDRLVFAKGIVLLAGATGLLIVLFGGNSHALVPLFAVGVFLSYTLSQMGMVVHWLRERGSGWRVKAIVNGVGAFATATTLFIVGANKFLEGAWITVLLIPILLIVFLKVHSYYQDLNRQLSQQQLPQLLLEPSPPLRVVVPVSRINRAMIEAVTFARSVSKNITAVYVEFERGAGQAISREWKLYWPDVPLVVLYSPYRSIVGPFLDFLDDSDRVHNDGQSAVVVLPEVVPAHWWQGMLHNRTARIIRDALLYHRRHSGLERVVIDVPHHLQD